MDPKTIKNLQENYSRQDIEQMLKPDENLSPQERLRESIRNKKLRRSGLHNLTYNMKKRMDIHKEQTPKKGRLEIMLESITTAKLKTLKKQNVVIDLEEYTRCLGIANEYLQLEDKVKVFDDIPEFEKIGNDNVRNIFKKIVYYEKYCQQDQDEIEEIEL